MGIDRAEREALIDSLEVGDLVSINGTARVVRHVKRGATRKSPFQSPERVYSVTFSILRCSWTRKPYTVKGRVDLYLVDMHVIKRGFGTIHGPIDLLLQTDIEDRPGQKTLLECCDVIGVTN